MYSVELRVDALDRLQELHNLNESKLAEKMQVSRTQIWKARLPLNDSRHCSPGVAFIAGALEAFPGTEFKDLFKTIKIEQSQKLIS